MIQFINEQGKASKDTPTVLKKDIINMYQYMVLIRIFDEIALKLQGEGRILTYASLRGQEASQVGTVLALEKNDWFVPSYRDNGVFITSGYPLAMLYQYWAGDARGMAIPQDNNILPIAIPVASQIPHAVGIAWAKALQKKNTVVAVYFGDGATSKGDFHVAMNFAGVFKVPCIFICQNNQWAISVPRGKQTGSETISQKAAGYGFEGVLVDGNDVLAVYQATRDAAAKARQGKGPTFIECFTYRLESHTTADDWKRYRNQREVDSWKDKDPLKRFEIYLQAQGILSKQEQTKIEQAARLQVNEAVKKFESIKAPLPQSIFEYIYEKLPLNLQEQLKNFNSHGKN